jgi:hypothetical protein
VGAVAQRHDKLALRAVEVTAPIGHDAVGTHGPGVVPIPRLPTVAADDVVWDAGLLLLRSNGGPNICVLGEINRCEVERCLFTK